MRHYNNTTHLEPKMSNMDHNCNEVAEEDQEAMDLYGMQASDDTMTS
jgi:hypothetical protein